MVDSPTPPTRRRRPRVYVGPVEDRHHEALARFFAASWGGAPDAGTVADWRVREARSNPAEPGVEPPKWVFTREDEVVGYLGTIPDRFALPGGVHAAYWLKGFWVDPAYRAGPVGFEILKLAVERLGATAASVVAPEARRLFSAHGLEDKGTLFNRLRLLRPGRILERVDAALIQGLPGVVGASLRMLRATRTTALAGGLVSVGLEAVARTRGRGSRGLRVSTGWAELTDERLDRLWIEVRPQLAGSAVRDGAGVRARYGDPSHYRAVAVFEGERLRGWATLRIPARAEGGRLSGLAVASLSDLLYPPSSPDVGRALVAAAEREARKLDADAILCSGSHTALDAVLSRRGFLPFPGNLHFMARDAAPLEFSGPFGAWWLTRGDGQSDGAF